MDYMLCLNTSTIKPQPLLDKIRLTAEAGFAGIELWLNDIYEFVGQGGEVSDIEKLLADTGLKTPCSIALQGWADASEFAYPMVLEDARRRLELAARLGITYLVCSPSMEPCDTEQIVRRYRDLLELGRQTGVRPTFEYISFLRSIYSLEQAWDIVQRADDPDATLIVDAFHTWNTHGTLEQLRAIPGDRISHYHIDDAHPSIPAGQQSDADRVMPGDGVIDLAAEIRTLRHIGYRGAISLELFQPELWSRDPRDVLRLGYDRLQLLLQS